VGGNRSTSSALEQTITVNPLSDFECCSPRLAARNCRGRYLARGSARTCLWIALLGVQALLLQPVRAAEIGGPAADSVRAAWKPIYARQSEIPFPADNLFSKEKELLGRTLFFDPRLSGSGWISCATCHNPGFAWGDGLATATGAGMKKLSRHTPTILNLAWTELLFWDGRAKSLEEQSLGPMDSPAEMNLGLKSLAPTVRAIPGYRSLFTAAFPSEPIDERTVAKAIATFERVVVSGIAPFDRWLSGDENAISADAKSGFDLFNGKAACSKCHSEWNFSDGGFHDTGIGGTDPGRAKHLNLPSMQHAFKTSSLRNIDRRAPYMHDGSLASLDQVLDFYNKGGEVRRPSLALEIVPLHLTASEKREVVEFLKTLTSSDELTQVPILPR
jgi:cytochrome c peroxidase